MPDETRQALPDHLALHDPEHCMCGQRELITRQEHAEVIRIVATERIQTLAERDRLRTEVERLQEAENKAWRESERWKEQAVDLRAEVEALKAEALDVCGITYGMLTAGIVDDHDRIMRAANELADSTRKTP